MPDYTDTSTALFTLSAFNRQLQVWNIYTNICKNVMVGFSHDHLKSWQNFQTIIKEINPDMVSGEYLPADANGYGLNMKHFMRFFPK